MKSISFVLSLLSQGIRRRNARLLVGLVVVFIALVGVYSLLFHVLMAREDRRHSWPTAVYWTLVTMTTLGFGDITFESDAGRIFSVVVLLSGTVFLLILLPFGFIQFVFVPWMNYREYARAPRQLPASTRGHLVLTSLGPIEDALIRRAELAGVPYVLMVGDLEEALRLHDRGYDVMVGNLDDPAAYRAARVDQAALVTATHNDTTNANIAFTVREIAPSVPLVATASKPASVDNLRLAGADAVLELGQMLGTTMAARTLAPDGLSHPIGEIAGVVIAASSIGSTALAGQPLAAAGLRAETGVWTLGIWSDGMFHVAHPETELTPTSVLILAGTPEQLQAYDERYALGPRLTGHTVVIGGGRVGRAAAQALLDHGDTCRIIEQRPERIRDPELYVLGDAADVEVLEAAGLREATAVVITTHDDDVNIYLTLYCQRLRPDVHVVARANRDRNVSTLYRAGADEVLSYASTGSAAIWNHFRGNDLLLVAEGLHVFRATVPKRMVGQTLGQSGLRRRTGLTLVAIERTDATTVPNPGVDEVLGAGDRLVLIGTLGDEQRFAQEYGRQRRRHQPVDDLALPTRPEIRTG